MASDLDDLADLERRLCEVLAAYFEAVKAGQAPERDAWLARHPELAGQLTAFLDEQDRLLRVTGPLRSIVERTRRPKSQADRGPRPARAERQRRTMTRRVPRSMSSATTSCSASRPTEG